MFRTPLPTVPNVLFIGPQRSGTTWIHVYLSAHPEVQLPKGIKESFFFDRHFEKGLGWYKKHFPLQGNTVRCIVETAPSLFHSLEAPQRVKCSLGSVKLVSTLRHPAERSFSHYLMLRAYGFTRAPLQEAVRSFPEIISASRYRACLEKWRSAFENQSVSIFWLEDMVQDQDRFVRQLCRCLGLSFFPLSAGLRANPNPGRWEGHPTLAPFGRKVAQKLRSRRWYGLINLAKRAGLKALFFGGSPNGSRPGMSPEDREWLLEQIGEETYFPPGPEGQEMPGGT